MAMVNDLFLSNGHLTKEALIDYARGKYEKGTLEHTVIAIHLKGRCDCEARRLKLTGDEILPAFEQDKKRGIWSRIRSFFHHFLGGSDEPFHG